MVHTRSSSILPCGGSRVLFVVISCLLASSMTTRMMVMANDGPAPGQPEPTKPHGGTAVTPTTMRPTAAPSVLPPGAPTPSPECPLECQNGGTCQTGEANYSLHPPEANGAALTFLQDTSRDGWHCDCPTGWTGIRCNRPFVLCPGKDTDASGTDTPHICYHGGKCIDGIEDATSIDESQLFCDCTDAEHNGIPYFGKFCEIQGATECAPGSEVFCVAQGTCKDGFETKVHPCECPTGHRGPHCEFLRGEVPECTKECQNEGECTLGVKDFDTARYQEFWMTHDENYQYCKCPEPWFGENCEVLGTPCGNSHCFNGGACLQTLNENDETTFACDCRVADANGDTWAGQYCEHSATATCQDGKQSTHFNGHLFCTNGGTCKAEVHLGCNCPEGQHGPRCEFNNPGDAAKCFLDCQNGGTCTIGHAQGSSFMGSFGGQLANLNTTSTELFQHCVCPEGFFGIQCEHELEVCPGGEHVCLHGSKCVPDFDNFDEDGNEAAVNHKCDCDEGFDAVEKYAGKFCQYTSTDICTTNGTPGVGKANFAFCVNNGICKARVSDDEAHPGCNCEDGFVGDHCEFSEDNEPLPGGPAPGSTPNTPVSASASSGDSNNNLVVGVASALIVTAIIAGYFVLRAMFRGGRGSKKQQAANAGAAVAAEEADSSSFSTSTGASSTGPKLFEEGAEEVEDYVNGSVANNGSFDEKELSNVQIV